jgi:hypothetical protein
VFQEYSRGIVHANDVRKIAEVPFPFPFMQMLQLMLVLMSVATPMVMSISCASIWWGAAWTFVSVLVSWCMNFVASEIEQPFGEDFNDLPISSYMDEMNTSLKQLLQPYSQAPPDFAYEVVQQHFKEGIDIGVTTQAEVAHGRHMPFPVLRSQSTVFWLLSSRRSCNKLLQSSSSFDTLESGPPHTTVGATSKVRRSGSSETLESGWSAGSGVRHPLANNHPARRLFGGNSRNNNSQRAPAGGAAVPLRRGSGSSNEVESSMVSTSAPTESSSDLSTLEAPSTRASFISSMGQSASSFMSIGVDGEVMHNRIAEEAYL